MSYDTINSGVLIAGCVSYGAGVGFNLLCHVWGKMKFRMNKKSGFSNEEAIERSNLLTGLRMLKYLAPLLLLMMQLEEVGYYNQIDTGLTTPVWFWVTLMATLPILAFDMFFESWSHTYNCIVGAALLAVSALLVVLSLLDSRLLLRFSLLSLGAFLVFALTVLSAFRSTRRRVRDETITSSQAARAKVLIILTFVFITFYVAPYVVGPGVAAKLDNNNVFIFYLCLDLVAKVGYDMLAWFMFELPSFKNTSVNAIKLH
jgi:bacteriorhodopsin